MKSDSRITEIRRGRFAHRREDSSRGERWVKRKWKVDSWAERVKGGQTKTRFFFLYLIECKVGVSSTVSCQTASVASSKVDCSNGVDTLSPVFRTRDFHLFVKLVSQTSCTPAVSIFLPQNQHQVPAGPAPPRCAPQHGRRAKSCKG